MSSAQLNTRQSSDDNTIDPRLTILSAIYDRAPHGSFISRSLLPNASWRQATIGRTPTPLLPDHLTQHLRGDLRVGVYMMAPGTSVTQLAVIDYDDHKGTRNFKDLLADARKVEQSLKKHSIECMTFRSGGGKGVHQWFLFDKPIEAKLVRDFLEDSIESAGLHIGIQGGSGIEIFPKQSALGSENTGNGVGLPFWLDTEQWLPATGHRPPAPILKINYAEIPAVTPRITFEDKRKPDLQPEQRADEWDRLRSALYSIPADEYDHWLKVGFALNHWDEGPEGLQEWIKWSNDNLTDKTKATPTDRSDDLWARMTPDKIAGTTRAYIYWLAGLHGWTPATFAQIATQKIKSAIDALTKDAVTDDELTRIFSLMKSSGLSAGAIGIHLKALNTQRGSNIGDTRKDYTNYLRSTNNAANNAQVNTADTHKRHADFCQKSIANRFEQRGLIYDGARFYGCYADKIWRTVEDEELRLLVADDIQNNENGARRADAVAVLEFLKDKLVDRNFFVERPAGVAAGGLFYRIDATVPTGYVAEPLTPDHRCRHAIPVAPRFEAPSPILDGFLCRAAIGYRAPPLTLQDYVDGLPKEEGDRRQWTPERQEEDRLYKLQQFTLWRDALLEFEGATLAGTGWDYQTALCSIGETATGKSTWGRLIKKLYPDVEFQEADLMSLRNPNIVQRLKGARRNETSEVSRYSKDPIPDEIFKRLTGQNCLEGKVLYQNSDQFYYQGTLVLACNSLPRTMDKDEAFFRRWLMLPWPYTVHDRIPKYEDTLATELPQLVAQLIVAAGRMAKKLVYTLPINHAEWIAKWKRYSDVVRHFMDDMIAKGVLEHEDTVRRRNETGNVFIGHVRLWGLFNGWMSLHGMKAEHGKGRFYEDIGRVCRALGATESRTGKLGNIVRGFQFTKLADEHRVNFFANKVKENDGEWLEEFLS